MGPRHRDRPHDEHPVAEQRPGDPGGDGDAGQREESRPPGRTTSPPSQWPRGGVGHGRVTPDAAISSSTSGPILVMSPVPMVSTRSPGPASEATTLGASPKSGTYLAAPPGTASATSLPVTPGS